LGKRRFEEAENRKGGRVNFQKRERKTGRRSGGEKKERLRGEIDIGSNLGKGLSGEKKKTIREEHSKKKKYSL